MINLHGRSFASMAEVRRYEGASVMFLPQEISDEMVAFPAYVVGTLLPNRDDIPEEFERLSSPWVKLVDQWFFCGIRMEDLIFKPEIDVDAALRHLRACLHSFQPKHEHKVSGIAYLLYLWCLPETVS